MPLGQLFNLFKTAQVAYHNLCTSIPPPPGTDKLLWNGLKFCIEHALPKPRLDNTFDRLTQDIRRRHFWSTRDATSTTDYNPKLYIKSNWEPGPATPELEAALQHFRTKITQLVRDNTLAQQRRHNLPAPTRRLLQILPKSVDHIILPTDKNLGPAIVERNVYKQRCLSDHLNDIGTYQRLTEAHAHRLLHTAETQFKDLVADYESTLPEGELTYFKRCFEETRRIPQFYCTPKVHKRPHWKTRPIVSCVNSRMGDLSKWVDVQLQRVVHLCPGYLKDSQSLLHRLHILGRLPPNAFLITADAVSMYTNIDTEHGIQTLQNWLSLHQHELPQNFPTRMVIRAVELVMKHNVFQFDDTFWLQLTGTAMGTSLACIYATIYYSYHEETSILPTYSAYNGAHRTSTPEPLTPVPLSTHTPLLLHARLIDDAIQIWDADRLPTRVLADFQNHMTKAMAYGTLAWEVDKPSKLVNFLDLTVEILPTGWIQTKTFVKPMNLHLYIPPRSAHPHGVLKSLIFGNLQRYWHQNTSREDFVQISTSFYRHLFNRGYTPSVITPIFQEAAAKIQSKTLQAAQHGDQLWLTPPTTPNDHLFIHWDFHPRDISRPTIHQVFSETLTPLL
jgi:hypothetical protein